MSAESRSNPGDYVTVHLLPDIELDLLEAMIRVQLRDHALDRVVEQYAADAPAFDAVSRRGAEERLVLPHRLAFVVVDRGTGIRPSAAPRTARLCRRDRAAQARPEPWSAPRGQSRRNR